MNEINNLVEGLLALGLDITKGYKQHKGVTGYVDAIASDPVVLESLKEVITNVTKLPADFKAMNMSDGLMLIGPIVRGIEAIVKEAQA